MKFQRHHFGTTFWLTHDGEQRRHSSAGSLALVCGGALSCCRRGCSVRGRTLLNRAVSFPSVPQYRSELMVVAGG
jgi:hypothetical protein